MYRVKYELIMSDNKKEIEKPGQRMEIDEEMVCGIENHMKNIFTDALC
jgi:hypothetical protein